MIATGTEPFGFFTWDAFRAGWYLSWRLFVRMLLAGIVLGIAVPIMVPLLGVIGGVIGVLGALAVVGWVFTLVPRIASEWSEQRYGRPLDRWLHVWWGITWRSVVVGLVCSVILGIPGGVGGSLVTVYQASALGFLGGLVLLLVVIANSIAGLLGQGWAMSRVVLKELGGAAPLAPTWTPQSELTPIVADPPPPAAPQATPTSVPSAPPRAGAEGKRQCPKCGLYETERGSVIGWYCKVCGWREVRR